ncbi:hypothetical protein HK101_011702 [Irineochytrium annulatum]|nr:hypothetical protein HK101_011702 [Irineochytrium annulatum]
MNKHLWTGGRRSSLEQTGASGPLSGSSPGLILGFPYQLPVSKLPPPLPEELIAPNPVADDQPARPRAPTSRSIQPALQPKLAVDTPAPMLAKGTAAKGAAKGKKNAPVAAANPASAGVAGGLASAAAPMKRGRGRPKKTEADRQREAAEKEAEANGKAIPVAKPKGKGAGGRAKQTKTSKKVSKKEEEESPIAIASRPKTSPVADDGMSSANACFGQTDDLLSLLNIGNDFLPAREPINPPSFSMFNSPMKHVDSSLSNPVSHTDLDRFLWDENLFSVADSLPEIGSSISIDMDRDDSKSFILPAVAASSSHSKKTSATSSSKTTAATLTLRNAAYTKESKDLNSDEAEETIDRDELEFLFDEYAKNISPVERLSLFQVPTSSPVYKNSTSFSVDQLELIKIQQRQLLQLSVQTFCIMSELHGEKSEEAKYWKGQLSILQENAVHGQAYHGETYHHSYLLDHLPHFVESIQSDRTTSIWREFKKSLQYQMTTYERQKIKLSNNCTTIVAGRQYPAPTPAGLQAVIAFAGNSFDPELIPRILRVRLSRVFLPEEDALLVRGWVFYGSFDAVRAFCLPNRSALDLRRRMAALRKRRDSRDLNADDDGGEALRTVLRRPYQPLTIYERDLLRAGVMEHGVAFRESAVSLFEQMPTGLMRAAWDAMFVRGEVACAFSGSMDPGAVISSYHSAIKKPTSWLVKSAEEFIRDREMALAARIFEPQVAKRKSRGDDGNAEGNVKRPKAPSKNRKERAVKLMDHITVRKELYVKTAPSTPVSSGPNSNSAAPKEEAVDLETFLNNAMRTEKDSKPVLSDVNFGDFLNITDTPSKRGSGDSLTMTAIDDPFFDFLSTMENTAAPSGPSFVQNDAIENLASAVLDLTSPFVKLPTLPPLPVAPVPLQTLLTPFATKRPNNPKRSPLQPRHVGNGTVAVDGPMLKLPAFPMDVGNVFSSSPVTTDFEFKKWGGEATVSAALNSSICLSTIEEELREPTPMSGRALDDALKDLFDADVGLRMGGATEPAATAVTAAEAGTGTWDWLMTSPIKPSPSREAGEGPTSKLPSPARKQQGKQKEDDEVLGGKALRNVGVGRGRIGRACKSTGGGTRLTTYTKGKRRACLTAMRNIVAMGVEQREHTASAEAEDASKKTTRRSDKLLAAALGGRKAPV